jgi:hypothetical protein
MIRNIKMSNEQTLAFEDREVKNSITQQSSNIPERTRSLPNQDYMTSVHPSSSTNPMAAQAINKQQASRVTAQLAGEKKPAKPAKMSKEEAKSLASSMKQIALATSIVAFVMFGGLIAPQIEAIASQSSTTTTQNATSTSTATQTPAASSGSFFNQSQTGGYSIGSSSSSSSSTTSSSNTATTPGTSTHVS